MRRAGREKFDGKAGCGFGLGCLIGALVILIPLVIILWPLIEFFARLILNEIFYGRNGLS